MYKSYWNAGISVVYLVFWRLLTVPDLQYIIHDIAFIIYYTKTSVAIEKLYAQKFSEPVRQGGSENRLK